MIKTASINIKTGAVTEIEREQTANEIEQSIKSQLGSEKEIIAQSNYASMVDKLKTALDDNKAYLAIASPLADQRNEQVKALTKQVNRLIRMQIRQLDSVE